MFSFSNNQILIADKKCKKMICFNWWMVSAKDQGLFQLVDGKKKLAVSRFIMLYLFIFMKERKTLKEGE